MSYEDLQIHAISDTHNRHKHFTLPGGDILIHSGDATSMGTLKEVTNFLAWLGDQDYAHRIFVPGNHDWLFEKNASLCEDECKARGIILLNDSGVTVEGIKIWGSPVQPEFGNWAFNRNSIEIIPHWDMIPEDTEILVTHGPPYRILDHVPEPWGGFRYVGCPQLTAKIMQTQVKLHIFGHIHYAAGHKYEEGRTYVNAAALTEEYTPSKGNPKKIVKDVSGEYFVEE